MEAEAALRRLGGVAGTADLLTLTTRRRLRTALDAGRIIHLSRGSYGLADVGWQRCTAAELTAVLSHLSAAQHHGWAVKHPPERAWVTVPRNRKVSRQVQARDVVVFADLDKYDVAQGATTPLRTVLDCARRLPFDEAPVTTRTMTFHPDLVDVRRRVVVEADSWTWHRDHQTHARDCVRHTAFAVAGWIVLRFTWEQVMHSPAYVTAVLHDLTAASDLPRWSA